MKVSMEHYELKLYTVHINDDPELQHVGLKLRRV